jgi:hypothetical protein
LETKVQKQTADGSIRNHPFQKPRTGGVGMRGKYHVVTMALLASCLLVAPLTARAGTFNGSDMQLELCTVNAGCNGPIDDGGTGHIQFGNINIGKWDVNFGNAFGSDGGLVLPHLLDLSSFDASSMGGGTGNDALQLKLTLTGLTGQQLLSVVQAIGGTNSFTSGFATVTSQSFISTLNSAFCLVGCHDLTNKLMFTTTGLGQPYSGSTTNSFGPTGNPYSLTLVVTVDATGTGHTSFDSSLDMLPEPATLSVLGTGLLALGTGLRKRLLRA